MAFALSNYEMNVKAATTAEDFQGIWIGALGTALIVIGVVWSGYRAENRGHAERRDDGNRQNNGIGFRDPVGCGHANRSLPRLWW